MKKAEYGEVLLDEFIQFFNSVMQIQDFKSFLQACQNVCLIVKKAKKEQKSNQSLKETIEKAAVANDVAGKGESERTTDNGNRASRAKRRREAKEAQSKLEEDKYAGQEEIAPQE